MKVFLIALVVAVSLFAAVAITYTVFALKADGKNIIQVSPDCVEIPAKTTPVAPGTYCKNR